MVYNMSNLFSFRVSDINDENQKDEEEEEEENPPQVAKGGSAKK